MGDDKRQQMFAQDVLINRRGKVFFEMIDDQVSASRILGQV